MAGLRGRNKTFKEEDVYKLASQLLPLNIGGDSSQVTLNPPVELASDMYQTPMYDGPIANSSSGYSSGYSGISFSSGATSKLDNSSLGGSMRTNSSYNDYPLDSNQWQDINLPSDSATAFSLGSSSSSYSLTGDSDSPPLSDPQQYPYMNSSTEFPLSHHYSSQGIPGDDMLPTYPDLYTSTPNKMGNGTDMWTDSSDMQNKCYALASMIANRESSSNGKHNRQLVDSSQSYVCGPGIQSAVRGKTASFQIIISDNRDLVCDSLNVVLIDPNNHPCATKIKQTSKFCFVVRYKPDFIGSYKACITLDGSHVQGSPCSIEVNGHHKLVGDGNVKAVIESDEVKSCSLNKPWGVCCNSNGYVFIGDRGNHTIRVFKPNFVYSHSIGSFGDMPGQLNKPAGVTCNNKEHIIVADKDNHRVQVFDIRGQVLLTFGNEGRGQLKYPWDVASDPHCNVMVTDRNKGRVAIFSSDGHFLTDIASDDQILREPRGLCFRLLDEKLIATDMTKHQVVVLDMAGGNAEESLPSKSCHPTLIGRKGNSPNEFNKPQGVACDQEGNLFVSDSRNSRVQIFDADANYVSHWNIDSPDSSVPAQPVGVAVSPAGHVLVVDAEYSRILIF